MKYRNLIYGIGLGFIAAGCAQNEHSASLADDSKGSKYLYLWSGDADKSAGDKDFLATVDVSQDSPDYGEVIATTPVNEVGTMPHHIEPSVSSDNRLYASGFMANKIYLFDMTDPASPTLVKTVHDVPGWKMSHSFIRTPDNNMVATLQYKAGDKSADGGLAIFDANGELLETLSAADPDFKKPIRSYGVDVLPMIDRLITSSTPMAMETPSSDVVQIYRLSDMKLLHTLALPIPEADPSRVHHPFEIRILKDGKTAMLNTFQCGFYLVQDIDTSKPTVEFAYALKGKKQRACSVPSIFGDYWIMPVQMSDEVVVLDISDTSNVREVFTLKFDEGFKPHYSAVEPGTNRIAFTGFMGKDLRVLMAKIDAKTGVISWDDSFRDPSTGNLGVDFKRASWPHGETGPAVPHGIVWSAE